MNWVANQWKPRNYFRPVVAGDLSLNLTAPEAWGPTSSRLAFSYRDGWTNSYGLKRNKRPMPDYTHYFFPCRNKLSGERNVRPHSSRGLHVRALEVSPFLLFCVCLFVRFSFPDSKKYDKIGITWTVRHCHVVILRTEAADSVQLASLVRCIKHGIRSNRNKGSGTVSLWFQRDVYLKIRELGC